MIVPTDGMPLAHSAALAVLSHFRTIRVPAGISGDLAWYLLHASRYMRWRLDIHIEGDWEMLLSATNSLAQTDRRFRIDTTDYPKYALLVYTNDIQNPTGIDLIDDEPPNTHEPPSQRHVDYCKVFFNCGLAGTHNFLFVQPDNVPLLPFQLLHRRMHGYTSPRIIKSPEERKARISHDVAAIECYLAKDPKREPWLICSLERRPFLQFLTDICTALPHAVPVVARYLALLPPGYALFSPTPQVPLFDAYLPLTKIPVAARRVPDHSSGWTVDFHEAKGQSNMRSALAQSQLLLSAIYDLLIRIRALGYACYLSGPGDVLWYILGNSKLPVDCRIHFVVMPVNGDSDVGNLRKLLCKEGLLAKYPSGGYVFAKRVDRAGKCCKVTIEQASLPPDVEMGATMDGIPIYSPASLVFNELSKCARLADRPTKKGLEGGRKENQLLKIVSGLKAFGRAKMDLRSAIMDVEKREMFDRLVVETCASHPDLTDDFAAVGFRGVFDKVDDTINRHSVKTMSDPDC